MSSDNYLCVRKVEGQWTFTDESASSEGIGPVGFDSPMFDTKLEAIEAASEYQSRNVVEYGIHIQKTRRCPHCGEEFGDA